MSTNPAAWSESAAWYLKRYREKARLTALADRENGDEMFLRGWEAAVEEVNARINKALEQS